MDPVPARPRRSKVIVRTVAVFTIVSAVLVGVAAGLSLAGTINTINEENFTEFAPALPTRLLDINGNLITEFSAEEKRELVTIDELPRHLIDAVIAREDQNFFSHRGFSLRGILRAAFGVFTGRNLGGGSTITQQVAGTLYADRTDRSIWRKLRELWWALQLERRYSKNEILELYLNKMYMGAGTYGVEAASKYYFGHSAREISLAESAILVIQLSSPAKYNPLDNPNVARSRQTEVLKRMVKLGFCSQEEADASFKYYWDNYDYTRVSSSAYLSRDDKAPWFSEYVRRQLSSLLYGALDLYKDGLTVHTTLDLSFQQYADVYMARGLEAANATFRQSNNQRLVVAENSVKPVVDLLGLAFGMEAIHASSGEQSEQKAQSRFIKRINPVIDALSLMFNITDLRVVSGQANSLLKTVAEENTVEGALVTIENGTGYIKALIGGSRYDQSNQLIRATQGKLMPGSTFKPLYYSAAIDSRTFTASTLIYDSPIVFFNEDNTPYIPSNFKGQWRGPVLLWYALAQSLNIPALKILDGIGFDAAIARAAALLGIEDKATIERNFPRYYPLGLGVSAVSPLQMARAYAIFANQGKEVTPIAIRSVEDRNGRVILDPEKELRLQQKKKGPALQIVSPQNAYVMTTLLQNTLTRGTLYRVTQAGRMFTYKDRNGVPYTIPVTGKTGTTQNWADAWTVGYSPLYTTAIWMGFDRPGNSLGVAQTGEMTTSPAWADMMFSIHEGVGPRSFARPSTGLIDVPVCSKSGLLPTEFCTEGTITCTFLSGTQPTSYCDLHQSPAANMTWSYRTMTDDTLGLDVEGSLGTIQIEAPNLDFLNAPAPTPRPSSGPTGAVELPGSTPLPLEPELPPLDTYNPLLN